MNIAQHITAKIYAKKMIEFLRRRQEQKALHSAMAEKIKKKTMETQ